MHPFFVSALGAPASRAADFRGCPRADASCIRPALRPATAVLRPSEKRSTTVAFFSRKSFGCRFIAHSPRGTCHVTLKTEIVSEAKEVADDAFKSEVLESPLPVLVDFWAPWCGPCRMVAPVVDEIALEYGNKLKVVKVNTDENPKVATEYGIRSIPSLMIFKNGQRVDTVVGAVPKTTLAATIEKYLDA
mmetsp:Transcript_46638/g.76148  ORF Transcript_46638/g.76148 Transcript_46638/m.76148 type:complete len:190 (+) Transcript_46638:38-607(+)